jgi:catechol 2,3-dioxygenase-like lactoylglutathione lyase family enzyme
MVRITIRATRTWRLWGATGMRTSSWCTYQLGNRYEHLALEADGDLRAYVDGLKAKGVRVLKDIYKSPSGTRAIAFVEDPHGIPVELLEPRHKKTLS